MSTILVSFDSKHVGQEAMHTGVYKSTNPNAVPIYQIQALENNIQEMAKSQKTNSYIYKNCHVELQQK